MKHNFIGRFYHALEQKGRLSIPKKFRDELGQSAILTQGLEKSLFLFDAEHWQQEASQVLQKPFTHKAARDWMRLLANSAVEVEFDTNGRILIPEHLQDYSKLQKDIVIVGSLNRVEIWSQPVYHTYYEALQDQAESIAERLSQDQVS